jgi:hypothetical protein
MSLILPRVPRRLPEKRAHQPPKPASVGVDEESRLIVRDGDRLPVERSDGTCAARLESRHEALLTSVGVHDVELVGCASDRLERGAGECDPRRPHLRGRVQPRRDRGGRSLGLRAASEHRDERDSDERDEGHDCRVLASATPRALPRFLDQRLDKSLELPRRDGIVWSAVGEAGR